MDEKPTQNAPRKLKFMPKAQPRRPPKPAVKVEKREDVDAVQAANLMRQFQERSSMGRPKVEKKVQASQIAFGFGAASNTLKSYGVPRGRSDRGGANSSGQGEDDYDEPWDYYSNYPVTLPLRRPYSGNPATLDAEEFGEAAEAAAYDEKAVNPAEELDLMEETAEPRMLFLQLPQALPAIKRSGTADGHEAQESKSTSGKARPPEIEKPSRLNQLPAGFMGKMFVYNNGSVKLKLGDTLYDVSPGMDCTFAQDVVAINAQEKQYCVVSEINKRGTVTPDVDAIISRMENFY